MARITVEDCIDKISNRFELVLIASQRARKLYTGDQPTIDKENDKNTVISLREIEDETISLENVKEDLINEYQTVSLIIDENDENEDISSSKENEDISSNEEKDDKKGIFEEVEKEIKSLQSEEDEKLKEQYEIKEINQNDDQNIATDDIEKK
tara:strand:+ start:59 stop:517 length:459 start_codon:yes stop_codon:yes gene_type:complete